MAAGSPGFEISHVSGRQMSPDIGSSLGSPTTTSALQWWRRVGKLGAPPACHALHLDLLVLGEHPPYREMLIRGVEQGTYGFRSGVSCESHTSRVLITACSSGPNEIRSLEARTTVWNPMIRASNPGNATSSLKSYYL